VDEEEGLANMEDGHDDREHPPQHQRRWRSPTSGPDLLGTCSSRDFIDCHVCCFITNRGRSIGCDFIDHCVGNTDHVGSIITVVPDHVYNVRRV
jgi:hypothetical protein